MTHERLTAMPQKGIPGHCHLAQIFGADGNSVACIDSTADPEIASERARRLVACWNACAGIDTDHLEQYGLSGFAQTISDLRAQRDELLAALQEVFVIGDRLVSDVYGHEFVEKARAAIQKAIGANKEGD